MRGPILFEGDFFQNPVNLMAAPALNGQLARILHEGGLRLVCVGRLFNELQTN